MRPVYVYGLDYALFQIWVLKCTGLVIGLGQGMTYIQEESKVLYQSKDGKKGKAFDALEWPRRRRRDASTRGHVLTHSQQRRVVRPGGLSALSLSAPLKGDVGSKTI